VTSCDRGANYTAADPLWSRKSKRVWGSWTVWSRDLAERRPTSKTDFEMVHQEIHNDVITIKVESFWGFPAGQKAPSWGKVIRPINHYLVIPTITKMLMTAETHEFSANNTVFDKTLFDHSNMHFSLSSEVRGEVKASISMAKHFCWGWVMKTVNLPLTYLNKQALQDFLESRSRCWGLSTLILREFWATIKIFNCLSTREWLWSLPGVSGSRTCTALPLICCVWSFHLFSLFLDISIPAGKVKIDVQHRSLRADDASRWWQILETTAHPRCHHGPGYFSPDSMPAVIGPRKYLHASRLRRSIPPLNACQDGAMLRSTKLVFWPERPQGC
jgi:hypothetical protein